MIAESGRIDVHFHAIPAFYKEALAQAGRAPTISTGYPPWSPELALQTMERQGIAAAITSISQPVHYGDDTQARLLARRCNEHAAELIARWPSRFGAYAAVPLPDTDAAIAEIEHALDRLKLDGVGLFASYGERFLGDAHFDPFMEILDERSAVAFIHPSYHPLSRKLNINIPANLVEFPLDTTRAAANMIFSGTLERFPRIRFILSHAGGALPYLSWRLAAAPKLDVMFKHLSRERVLAQIRSYWYDVAVSPGKATFGALSEVAAPDRILFGSDWPWVPDELIRETRQELAEAVSDRRQLDRINRDNALALFPRLGARS